MRKSLFLKLLSALTVFSVMFSACSSAATATPAPAATAAPQQPTDTVQSPAQTTLLPTDLPPTASSTAWPQVVTTPSGKKSASGFDCPEPNPRVDIKSKQLNLFVWTEYIPQDIIDCFQAVYGIKVNKDEYSSNEEMYAKLSAGGSSYDLVQPTDYIVSVMIRQKVLQPIDHSKLPVLSNFDPNYMNLSFDPGNVYTIPYEAGTDALVYNADQIKNPPKSFADLWNPDYADHLIMLDGSRDDIGMALLALGYDVNTKDPKQINAAKDKLKLLAKGVKLWDSDSPKTALIAGDATVGYTWTADAFLAQKEKPAITYVYPTEGAILWQDSWAIPKDAPHLDVVYAWLNYSMQGDVFWTMLRDFPYTNPNLAALSYAKDNQPDLFKAYMDSPITNTPLDELKKGHRVDDVGDATPLYDKAYTEAKGGQ
jgi:spermidine/putrescine-binding protein